MNTSVITIEVELDETKVPDKIKWNASGSTADSFQEARALMLAFWDGEDKSALRIDLWTKDMMVDEMTDFFYQTMMGMADTYNRATHYTALMEEMKAFAKSFNQKARALQLQENKLV